MESQQSQRLTKLQINSNPFPNKTIINLTILINNKNINHPIPSFKHPNKKTSLINTHLKNKIRFHRS